MRNVIVMVAALVLAGFVYGQEKPKDTVDPDAYRAAQERLAAKSAEKNAERAKMVSISQGELDDLRARVRELEAEVAGLRGGATKPAVAKRNPTKIEPGMTREEVERFVKSKLGGMRIAESSVSTAGGDRRERMRIEKLSKVRERTGTQGSLFGQSRAAYGNVDHVDGEINVVFENGAVTSVSGQ